MCALAGAGCGSSPAANPDGGLGPDEIPLVVDQRCPGGPDCPDTGDGKLYAGAARRDVTPAIEPFVDPIYLLPYDNRSWFAPAYGTWYQSGGQKGEKPSGPMADAIKLYDQFKSTIDPQKQIDIGKQIVKLSHENLWVIGTVGAIPSIEVVKNNFRNVPEQAVTDWIYMSPGNLDPPQFFFRK